MCGRILITTPVAELAALFGFAERPNLGPRYNVAPTQEVPVVRATDGVRHLALPRWGLVPPWAEDTRGAARLINARAETAATTPAFRSAFRQRRALVPADGFYEWRTDPVSRRKQGFVIRRRDRRPLAFAALWERWAGPKGQPAAEAVETVAVLTTTANATLAPLHDRMPVILDEADWATWLAPDTPVPALAALLRPAPADLLEAVAVGSRVNSVRNDDPSCLDPDDAQALLL